MSKDSNEARVGLRTTATHDARCDVEASNVFVPHDYNVYMNDRDESDSNNMYMTELEAIEWARTHPHIELDADTSRPNDLLKGGNQAVMDDITEGYNFDLEDYGPDSVQADDDTDEEHAEPVEARPSYDDYDVNMIGNFAPELDIDQL